MEKTMLTWKKWILKEASGEDFELARDVLKASKERRLVDPDSPLGIRLAAEKEQDLYSRMYAQKLPKETEAGEKRTGRTGLWEFSGLITNPGVTAGRAISLAKSIFEGGGPVYPGKYFEKIDRRDMGEWTATKVPEGWQVKVAFKAVLIEVPDIPEEQRAAEAARDELIDGIDSENPTPVPEETIATVEKWMAKTGQGWSPEIRDAIRTGKPLDPEIITVLKTQIVFPRRAKGIPKRNPSLQELASVGITPKKDETPIETKTPKQWVFSLKVPASQAASQSDAAASAIAVLKSSGAARFQNVQGTGMEVEKEPNEWTVSISFTGDPRSTWTPEMEEEYWNLGFQPQD